VKSNIRQRKVVSFESSPGLRNKHPNSSRKEEQNEAQGKGAGSFNMAERQLTATYDEFILRQAADGPWDGSTI
jgi:hypothetical protein